MAVAVIIRYPDLSPTIYDDAIASLDLDANPPAGAVLHVAAEAEGGLVVTEIWRTEQTFQAFYDYRLVPASGRTGWPRSRRSRSRRSTTCSPSRWTRSSAWARSRSRRPTRVRRSRSAAPASARIRPVARAVSTGSARPGTRRRLRVVLIHTSMRIRTTFRARRDLSSSRRASSSAGLTDRVVLPAPRPSRPSPRPAYVPRPPMLSAVATSSPASESAGASRSLRS